MSGEILVGDAFEKLASLPADSIQCCITSPPYWGLRDYGVSGQMGLESSPVEFVNTLRLLFEQVRRVLKPNGTLWLNLGDSYASAGKSRSKEQSVRKSTLRGGLATQAGVICQIPKVRGGLKAKDLCGIPWRVAFALQDDGWYLRQDIIWHKPNPMPESIRDRCTKAHEYLFLFSKSPKYLYNVDAIREPCKWPKGPNSPHSIKSPYAQGFGKKAKAFHDHKDDLSVGQRVDIKANHPLGKNKRSVWTISTAPFKEAHFATFPPKLVEPCILAGSSAGDTILDPFFGAGTVGLVAKKHSRNYIGIELNPEYASMALRRIEGKGA